MASANSAYTDTHTHTHTHTHLLTRRRGGGVVTFACRACSTEKVQALRPSRSCSWQHRGGRGWGGGEVVVHKHQAIQATQIRGGGGLVRLTSPNRTGLGPRTPLQNAGHTPSTKKWHGEEESRHPRNLQPLKALQPLHPRLHAGQPPFQHWAGGGEGEGVGGSCHEEL